MPMQVHAGKMELIEGLTYLKYYTAKEIQQKTTHYAGKPSIPARGLYSEVKPTNLQTLESSQLLAFALSKVSHFPRLSILETNIKPKYQEVNARYSN